MKVKYTQYHEGDYLTLNEIYPVHNNKIYHDNYKNNTQYYILNDIPLLRFYNSEDFELIED